MFSIYILLGSESLPFNVLYKNIATKTLCMINILDKGNSVSGLTSDIITQIV